MGVHISKGFNQGSNKILALHELLLRTPKKPHSAFEAEILKGMIGAGFEDGKGRVYLSEMRIKEVFSLFAGEASALLKVPFTQLQQAMDRCTDHSAKTQSGALKPITFW